jgi:hypothetical protein
MVLSSAVVGFVVVWSMGASSVAVGFVAGS